MQDREHIIRLGKMLAAEAQRGCDDGAAEDGLTQFLAAWQATAGAALAEPAVQTVLALLADYDQQTLVERRAYVGQALTDLRTIFRPAPVPPQPPPAPPLPKKRPAPQAVPVAPLPKKRPAIAKHPPASAKLAEALTLGDPLEVVPELGQADVRAFKHLGLRTIEDLLYHFPHRYDDLSTQRGIAGLVVGTTGAIIGEVTDVRVFNGPPARVEVTVSDHTGSIRAVYFNQPWLARQFTLGRMITLGGKVSLYNGVRQFAKPTWEPYTPEADLVHTGRLVPVHPLTKGLLERNARKTIKFLVDLMTPKVPDHLPAPTLEREALLPLGKALAQIHYPDDQTQLDRARERLGFDELLFIQLGVMQRKLNWQNELGYQINLLPDLHADLLIHQEFTLTGAQQRVIAEIFNDLGRSLPMARLLQGDVGSGKTAVAAAALVQVIGNGFQGALMAPTEILAGQHYKKLKRLLGKVRVPRKGLQGADGANWQAQLDQEEAARLAEIKALLGMTEQDDMDGQGIRVALLTGSLGVRERRRVLEGIARGEVDLVIGTHALFAEKVRFNALGLVVVDEQHRFGVEERQRLRDKGFNPHMLVMTATPIPRTLTLTVYGDLDASLLDELPPNRQTIRTRWVRKADRNKAYRHMRKEIEQGRQVFVVCPLIEESETLDLPSAEEMYEQLQTTVFSDRRVVLLHGRMRGQEKDEVMVAFLAHEYDIMVATAVIEVGIDIPNASTIVIEGAERFGLAQLHQFRGRVGRGPYQSYCILISDKDDNETTAKRLTALEASTDGFALAEIDLQLRGPGEFFGTRQSGTPDLKIASTADIKLLQRARKEAELILTDDPQLARPEHALLKQKVDAFWVEAMKAG